jgi:hypothetical protein
MRALSKILTEALEDNVSTERLVALVIEMEKEMKSMDFTEPLYQYFKKIMQREDPKGL